MTATRSKKTAASDGKNKEQSAATSKPPAKNMASTTAPKKVTPVKKAKGKAPSPRKVKTYATTKTKGPQAHHRIVCSTKANVLTIYLLHATKSEGAYLGDISSNVNDLHCDLFNDIISLPCVHVTADGEICTQTPNVKYYWYQFIYILDPKEENNTATHRIWGEKVAQAFTDYAKDAGKEGMYFTYPCQYKFHQDVTPKPSNILALLHYMGQEQASTLLHQQFGREDGQDLEYNPYTVLNHYCDQYFTVPHILVLTLLCT